MQETLEYSLMASGLGIVIVFSCLVLLSLLMVIIKHLADNIGVKKVKADEVIQVVKVEGHSQAPAAGTEWIMAAVAAFLALEESDSQKPSAASWQSSNSEADSPWVTVKPVSNFKPGA